MTRAAELVIDRQALRDNLQLARSLVSASQWPTQLATSKILSVIKDNGYGHGMVTAANSFAAADGFGVACMEEAEGLRQAGIKQPIVLLSGFYDKDELYCAVDLGLTVVVHHAGQLELLEQLSDKKRPPLWLKVDTGMHRLGFRPEEIKTVWQWMQSLSHEPVLMTHLANADDRNDNTTSVQLACFQSARDALHATTTSVSNSAGLLGWNSNSSHSDWVRPGLMLYGVSPFSDSVSTDHGLKPAMTLKSRLMVVNHCRKGDRIGYGGAWRCPEDMAVGVVAIGYGDGYPRSAENGTPVLLNGREVPLVGHVSMDMMTVDLRSQPDAQLGDPVVLWGEGLLVETVARHAGRIPYELLCGVAARVRRFEVG